MLKNYRVEFDFGEYKPQINGNTLDESSDKYYQIIKRVFGILSQSGVQYYWLFYEPYVEITWLSVYDQKENCKNITTLLLEVGCLNISFKTPEDGLFSDWWCMNEQEREFGAKRHSLCRQFVELYQEYKPYVDSGKGLRKQVERTIHTLCNPVGITYKEEYKLCFSRGLICLLFTMFSFHRAVWIYRNIFRQSY